MTTNREESLNFVRIMMMLWFILIFWVSSVQKVETIKIQSYTSHIFIFLQRFQWQPIGKNFKVSCNFEDIP